jgi:predicted secreted protein
LAVASAIPLEDTEEVKAAKEAFAKAFADAEAGAHSALAPVQGPTMYLADTEEVAAAKAAYAGHITVQGPTQYLADLPEVAEAKAAFKATFDQFANGEVPLPVAPVHTITPVVNALPAPVAAPVLAAPHYYNGYFGYPGYAGYAGHLGGYYGHPYAHAGYAGYPFGYPVVAPAPAAAAE